jgi:hypothetical protein
LVAFRLGAAAPFEGVFATGLQGIDRAVMALPYARLRSVD